MIWIIMILVLNYCALGLGSEVFDPWQILLGCLVMDKLLV